MEKREQQPTTAKRKAAFLDSLSRHGVLIRAARDASPDSQLGALQTFKDLRSREPEFAQAWDEALQAADGNLLVELHRRAVEGTSEPVFGSTGQQVGSKRKYSDRLLIEKLRSRFPNDFAARSVSEVKQTTIKAETKLGLDQLSPESRAELRKILERELERTTESQPRPEDAQ